MSELAARTIRLAPNSLADIKRASARDPARAPLANNLNILNTHLLKLHATFKRDQDGGVYIRDQFLTFGTVLNGRVLSPKYWFPVEQGDVLQLIILKPSVFIRRRLEGSTAQSLDLSDFGNAQTALIYSVLLDGGDSALRLVPLTTRPTADGLQGALLSSAMSAAKVHPVLNYDAIEMSAWGLLEGAHHEKFTSELDDSVSQNLDDNELTTTTTTTVVVEEIEESDTELAKDSERASEVVFVVRDDGKSREDGLNAFYEDIPEDDKDWNEEEDVAQEVEEEEEEDESDVSDANQDPDELKDLYDDLKCGENKATSTLWCCSGFSCHPGSNNGTCNAILLGDSESEEEAEMTSEEEEGDEDGQDDGDLSTAYSCGLTEYSRIVALDENYDDYDECDDDDYEAVIEEQPSSCSCRKRGASERDEEDYNESGQEPEDGRPLKRARSSKLEGAAEVFKAVAKEALKGSLYAIATIVALGLYGQGSK